MAVFALRITMSMRTSVCVVVLFFTLLVGQTSAQWPTGAPTYAPKLAPVYSPPEYAPETTPVQSPVGAPAETPAVVPVAPPGWSLGSPLSISCRSWLWFLHVPGRFSDLILVGHTNLVAQAVKFAACDWQLCTAHSCSFHSWAEPRRGTHQRSRAFSTGSWTQPKHIQCFQKFGRARQRSVHESRSICAPLTTTLKLKYLGRDHAMHKLYSIWI